MKFNKPKINTQKTTIQAKSKIQTAMNTTRNKLNMGTFNPDAFTIEHLTIKDRRIPKKFNNYTLVHLTDIHLGQWINKTKLDGIVQLTNNQNPDTILLTGDYLSYQTKNYLKELETSLKKLNPKDKTISVLGNHDHWMDAKKVKEALNNANIINLENDVYPLQKQNKTLQIAGVDSITLHKDDIEKVKEKLEKNTPAIMLAHEPDFADTTGKLPQFILQLSGHSHGGQITLPHIGTPIRGKNFIKYPIGKYQIENLTQYTSRGVGTNAFWIRINCTPEITKITLKSR